MFLSTEKDGHPVLYFSTAERTFAALPACQDSLILLILGGDPATRIAGITTTIGRNTVLVDTDSHENSHLLTARTVRLLDMTVARPTVCLELKNVTDYLLDDSRDLIYFANGRRLWVVHYNG